MNIKRPIGVTIISILIILNGSFLLFSGIVTFFLASNFAANLDSFDLTSLISSEANNTIFSNNDPNLIKNFSYFIYLLAVIITLFSLIHFIIAYGLLKGKSWARLTTLIISMISVIGNILMILIVLGLFFIVESISSTPSILFGNVLTIIINTLIIFYLLRQEVKDYFTYRSSNKSSFSSSFDDLR
ncbi:MAG: hypothetical protein ACRD8K_09950 [Nitrososphaeraceae archaeon]